MADDEKKQNLMDPSADEEPSGSELAEADAVSLDKLREDLESAKRELAEKTAEAAQKHDLYLRERAELENFKRRLEREKAEALRFANESLIRALLPVLDNLERAVSHAESGGNGQPLVEGVQLVLKSALDVLERHGVRRVEAVGQQFDPNLHEAVAQVPAPDREPNQVVDQLLPGYSLHDRLLRPAQVTVSGKAPVEKGQNDD